ncbi:tubulin-tyrosine ligase [Thelephora ganbajun]|uniref:Tubulin-tyrosine ligase n=1 Tax=Thelephora ganbajun TaxID=370292 RepID=A0ACB6ZPL9_THEGA|nr:tubulin-tyrosine ligase [Thelephora ganbajun]
MTEVATAFVDWPSAPLTKSLVERAIKSLPHPIEIEDALPKDFIANPPTKRLVQWATYDSIDHELTAQARDTVLSSSYTFRKALIRKHFLSRTIHSYVTKHPDSPLARAVPRTWEIELTFADELDEMWMDELFDLAELLEEPGDSKPHWYILKPGMADRGIGIRLFNSKDALQSIFEEFEENEDAEDEDEGDTAVVVSQLRHFVIQEYLANPLLLDPDQSAGKAVTNPRGYKFHLRVYCVASGALKVYLYTRILALFSSVPFALPKAGDSNPSLKPHLTNTSLQMDQGEACVRLLSELVGCQILSPGCDRKLTEEDVNDLINHIGKILSETFKAALENPVHFQPLPNAFELFGVDFVVTCENSKLQPYLLEMNSEPAIELTGPRLTWVLEDLFMGTARVAVKPHLDTVESPEGGHALERDGHFSKCLDVEVRGEGGW